MPKTVDNTPEAIKPYAFHGVDFDLTGQQAVADCPFCGKERKLYVDKDKGLWQCKVCMSGSEKGGGNIYTFLTLLHEASARNTTDYDNLLLHRGLTSSQTLVDWGVCQSILTGEWVVPAYNVEGKLANLYRYVEVNGKSSLYATPTLRHGLHGVNLFDGSKPDVHLCEGPWDGMIMYETLRIGKRDGDKLVLTGSISSSLASRANVLATPGANVFNADWCQLLAGKNLYMPFDSDHPVERNGRTFPPVGFAGVERNSLTCAAAEEKPESIHYLYWGPDGYDPDLPSGTDIRDVIKAEETPEGRLEALGSILAAMVHIPEEWIGARTPAAKARGGTELELVPCTDWKALQNAWRRAMKFTEGLDRALSCMLASVISTRAVGDQLWMKIIGPAACGKSTLCEAVSTNREFVIAKSTMTGFHSGFRVDKHGSDEDNSLTAQLYNKTLVTKDGDTLLQSPNLGVILSQARDIYDRVSRTHYGNKMGRDYHGLSMTWLLCGTSSLRSLDSSELGERFLDCVIMDGIDDDVEDEILLRVAHRVDRNMALESGKDLRSHNDDDMTLAMQMTGGYVAYLRNNAQRLLSAVSIPEAAMMKIIHLGKFTAYMRARPSERQDEKAEREFSTRLVSQLVRLAKCLGAVLGVTSVNDEVLRRVKRTAMDTSRGRTLEILKFLHQEGRATGAQVKAVALHTSQTEDKERQMLRFLKQIGAVETFYHQVARGMSAQVRWRLTERMETLYTNVSAEEE